jgi:hypothetical protein
LFSDLKNYEDSWVYTDKPKSPCLVSLSEDFVFCGDQKQVEVYAKCYEIVAWLPIALPPNHKIDSTTAAVT